LARIEIEPAEADIVRRIYRAYAGGSSMKRIVFELNREHVPFPRQGHQARASATRLGTLERPDDPAQRALSRRLDLEQDAFPEGPGHGATADSHAAGR